jgi:hypothetical protein
MGVEVCRDTDLELIDGRAPELHVLFDEMIYLPEMDFSLPLHYRRSDLPDCELR